MLYHQTLHKKDILNYLPAVFSFHHKYRILDVSLKCFTVIPDTGIDVYVPTQDNSIIVIDKFYNNEDTRSLLFKNEPTLIQVHVRLKRDLYGNPSVDFSFPNFQYMK